MAAERAAEDTELPTAVEETEDTADGELADQEEAQSLADSASSVASIYGEEEAVLQWRQQPHRLAAGGAARAAANCRGRGGDGGGGGGGRGRGRGRGAAAWAALLQPRSRAVQRSTPGSTSTSTSSASAWRGKARCMVPELN